jgi:hypothetical protein
MPEKEEAEEPEAETPARPDSVRRTENPRHSRGRAADTAGIESRTFVSFYRDNQVEQVHSDTDRRVCRRYTALAVLNSDLGDSTAGKFFAQTGTAQEDGLLASWKFCERSEILRR